MPDNVELPKEVYLCGFLPGGILFGRPASNCPAFLDGDYCRKQRLDAAVGGEGDRFAACTARRCYLVDADEQDALRTSP